MVHSLKSRFIAVAALSLAGATSASAHAGDHVGGLGATLLHMLGNIDHLLILLAAVVAAVGLRFGLKSMRRSR